MKAFADRSDLFKTGLALILLAFVLVIPIPRGAVLADDGPAGRAVGAREAADEPLTALVVLREQADLKGVRGATRAERQQRVILALKDKAARTQGRLHGYLRSAEARGLVSSFEPLWIQNAVLVTGARGVLDELATWPEVAAIIPESSIAAPELISSAPAPVEPNLALIGAPALWERGYRGQGVVVGLLDTGVDVSHPDLRDRWRGGAYSWYDPYGERPSAPVDTSGHGTWTAGVIVGGSASGRAIGVAPDAQWIAARIFNDRGRATTSAVHRAFQWMLDPDGNPATPDAPHVVNNSWTFGGPGCNLEFEPDLQSLAAAGIVAVFAAGNFGPNAATSASPANNPSALPVGATDNADALYASSSRGPTDCGGSLRAYPALVAPGVGIYTTDRYGLYTRATGTSEAAPHVTGALALLLSAYPDLTVEQQRAALTGAAADLGPGGPDDGFGAGRLDVQAAFDSLTTPSPAAPLVFADGFESGDMAAWDAAETGGGTLSVTSAAALVGAAGLQAELRDARPLYVADASPDGEGEYHARFYFSAHAARFKRGTRHDLFQALDAAGKVVARLQIQYASRGYEVRAAVRANDQGTELTSPWYLVDAAPHALEIGWRAAGDMNAGNGSLAFWLDAAPGNPAPTFRVDTLANPADRIEEVRLGPAVLTAGISGTEYYDDFISTRGSYIGPTE